MYRALSHIGSFYKSKATWDASLWQLHKPFHSTLFWIVSIRTRSRTVSRRWEPKWMKKNRRGPMNRLNSIIIQIIFLYSNDKPHLFCFFFIWRKYSEYIYLSNCVAVRASCLLMLWLSLQNHKMLFRKYTFYTHKKLIIAELIYYDSVSVVVLFMRF